MEKHQTLQMEIDAVTLTGELSIPDNSIGLVIFSHGSGSSRFSPRNTFVASYLRQSGLATFLFDLLTKGEDQIFENRFNIELLTHRLVLVTEYLLEQNIVKGLSIGYFGASTGAASAISAAAHLPNIIGAVVSRGGRPDLALGKLKLLYAPALMIVGELDREVIELNEQAMDEIPGRKKLVIVDGATHLFEEPGTLEQVARLSAEWFVKYLHPKHAAKIDVRNIILDV